LADPDEIILVHGLWYRAWSMRVLAGRLASSGFAVRSFSYPTRTRSPGENAAALQRFVLASAAERRHLVAHSLGGLIVLEMLAATPALPPGRLVLLGVPLQGSATAGRVLGWPGGRFLLGEAAAVLSGGAECAAMARETGMIAGIRPVGLGRLAGGLDPPHDGTVSVRETRSNLLADSIELPVTHTGMLVAREVADQAAHFLETGRFRR